MRCIAVIPARYASTRLPAKALARETGKYLIEHVYERVSAARGLDAVMIATDDERIAAAVESFGGKYVMTRADHPSGTDRVAEVAAKVECDIAINIQGDEPEMEPESVEALVALATRRTAPMATLACPFSALAARGIDVEASAPSCVKVVCGAGKALYFSRSLIPYERNALPEFGGPYLHLGVYAYEREFLLGLAKLAPTPLERIEGLEQLRVLEHGYDIAVGIVPRGSVGIDTPADYAAFVKRYEASMSEAVG